MNLSNYKSLDQSDDNNFFDSLRVARDSAIGFISHNVTSKSVAVVTVGLVSIAAASNAVAGVDINQEFQEVANWFSSLGVPTDTIADTTQLATELNVAPPESQPIATIMDVVNQVELTTDQLDAQDYQSAMSDGSSLEASFNQEITKHNPEILAESIKHSVDIAKESVEATKDAITVAIDAIDSTATQVLELNPSEVFQNEFASLVEQVKNVVSSEHFEGHFLAPDQVDILAELDKTLIQCNTQGIDSFSNDDFKNIIDQVSKMEFVLDDVGDKIAQSLKDNAVELAKDIGQHRSMG